MHFSSHELHLGRRSRAGFFSDPTPPSCPPRTRAPNAKTAGTPSAPAAPFYASSRVVLRGLFRRAVARCVLVRPGALGELLIERAQRLVGGAAEGAGQWGAVLPQGVRVLADEALLQLDDRR